MRAIVNEGRLEQALLRELRVPQRIDGMWVGYVLGGNSTSIIVMFPCRSHRLFWVWPEYFVGDIGRECFQAA